MAVPIRGFFVMTGIAKIGVVPRLATGNKNIHAIGRADGWWDVVTRTECQFRTTPALIA